MDLSDGASYLVQRVVDGDTIVLSNGLHVRYSGIDTPERGRYVRESEPHADRATARNRELVQGKRVRLTFERERVDRYGRVLAHVYLEDGDKRVSVEDILVREGLARAVNIGQGNDRYRRLKEVESEARAAKRGQWADSEAVAAAMKGAKNRTGGGGGSAAKLVARRTGGVIHVRECLHAARMDKSDLTRYRDLADAQKSGRAFCKVCKPENRASE